MCESNVYFLKEGEEELVLEDVELIVPDGDEIVLKSIFGEQKRLKAKIKEINLVGHRIVLIP